MESRWGWMQASSKFASSSPRLRVVHCHVQLKCAFSMDGTGMEISDDNRKGEGEFTHVA
jgi:hypothetical protein